GAEAAADPGPVAAVGVRHERHRVLDPQPGARGRAVGSPGAPLRPVDPACRRVRVRDDRDGDPDVRIRRLGAVRLPLRHRSAARRLRGLRLHLRPLPAPAGRGLARHARHQRLWPGRLEAFPPPAARRPVAAGPARRIAPSGPPSPLPPPPPPPPPPPATPPLPPPYH